MTDTELTAAASGTFALGGDLTVNRLGFGSMQLPGPGVWGESRDPEGAVRVLQRAVELGVNFIDTADSYGPVVAEQLIKKALHPYRDDLVIATKAGLTRQGPDQWTPVGRPAYLRQLALAWLLKRSPVMLPIPGTSSVDHLEDNIAGASVTLSDEDFEAISAAV